MWEFYSVDDKQERTLTQSGKVNEKKMYADWKITAATSEWY